MYERSRKLFEQSQQLIPGGVNSPVRAFRAVGGTPVFFREGKGARLVDEDGREYIDYVGSWGPLILGHAHPDVVSAVTAAAQRGLSFGAPTALELEMAQLLTRSLPSVEQGAARELGNRGGDERPAPRARLYRARGDREVRGLLSRPQRLPAGEGRAPGALTFGNPTSAGVPAELTSHTLVLDYNDPQQVADAFARYGDTIAAVVLEPVAGNMNFVRPSQEFMDGLRAACTKHGAVLIFDEVMTGFRVGAGGAQGIFGITPDLTTLGKVIGGGMPVGAFGGPARHHAEARARGTRVPGGDAFRKPGGGERGASPRSGTCCAPDSSRRWAPRQRRSTEGLAREAAAAGIPFSAASLGGMFGLFFRAAPPRSFAEVMESDRDAFNRFFHAMLERGVYLAPSAYEAGFVSSAHGEGEIAATLAAARAAFASMRGG
jgi:glutamate-1-semialdehyde 2,1-aminomutase